MNDIEIYTRYLSVNSTTRFLAFFCQKMGIFTQKMPILPSKTPVQALHAGSPSRYPNLRESNQQCLRSRTWQESALSVFPVPDISTP
jgi:hypothetical protein